MPFEMPVDPRTERRARFTRWVSFLLAAMLLMLVAYFAYVGYEGSRQLADSPTDSTDCRTPAAMGWTYEAINYDIATDAALIDEADPTNCTTQAHPRLPQPRPQRARRHDPGRARGRGPARHARLA
jgi:hypothetical protein